MTKSFIICIDGKVILFLTFFDRFVNTDWIWACPEIWLSFFPLDLITFNWKLVRKILKSFKWKIYVLNKYNCVFLVWSTLFFNFLPSGMAYFLLLILSQNLDLLWNIQHKDLWVITLPCWNQIIWSLPCWIWNRTGPFGVFHTF